MATVAIPTVENTVPGGVAQDHTLAYVIVGAILFYVIVIKGGRL